MTDDVRRLIADLRHVEQCSLGRPRGITTCTAGAHREGLLREVVNALSKMVEERDRIMPKVDSAHDALAEKCDAMENRAERAEAERDSATDKLKFNMARAERAEAERDALREALGRLEEHMAWKVSYVHGNTYEVACRCGWAAQVAGDSSEFEKRAAAWAAHVLAILSPTREKERT